MNSFLESTDSILDLSTLLLAATGTVWFALRERSRRRSIEAVSIKHRQGGGF